jgi:GrpB-like predicted nucleotidyltransferase (UPF0157 family)
MADLVWSDGLLDEAHAARDDVAAALRHLGVPGDLVLTGATSVAGALTKGDVDLHLRVDPGHYTAAVALLGETYEAASLDAWEDTLAVFDVPRPRPTGLAVTPVGSVHDRRFRATWRVLRRDRLRLAEYNALKRTAYGTDDYERRKSAFFTAIADDALD